MNYFRNNLAVYKNYIVEIQGVYNMWTGFRVTCIIRVDFEGDLEGLKIEVPLKDLRELTEEKKAQLL